MSRISRRLSSVLCLAANDSSLTLASEKALLGSSLKSHMDTSSSFDDRLPSYDEVDYKCYTGDDVSTVDTKTSLAEPKRERKTLEDVLDIGRPPAYMRWFKAAFSSQYQELQAVKKELEVLREYDTIIIVDDSSSMIKEDRWGTACEALAKFADAAMIYDKNGVDIYFLNNATLDGENLKSSDAVKALFQVVYPTFGTPIGKRLKELTKLYMENLWEAHGRSEQVKPRNYIIITDGVPTSKKDLVDAIQGISSKLSELNCPANQLGIQFIQVGNSRSAAKFLRELDDDEGLKKFPRDIVDASPYTAGAGLSAEHILKVMKGAIDRRIDGTGSV